MTTIIQSKYAVFLVGREVLETIGLKPIAMSETLGSSDWPDWVTFPPLNHRPQEPVAPQREGEGLCQEDRGHGCQLTEHLLPHPGSDGEEFEKVG